MKLATGEFQKPEKMDRSSNSNNGLAANFAERDSTQKVREGLTDRQTEATKQRHPQEGGRPTQHLSCSPGSQKHRQGERTN